MRFARSSNSASGSGGLCRSASLNLPSTPLGRPVFNRLRLNTILGEIFLRKRGTNRSIFETGNLNNLGSPAGGNSSGNESSPGEEFFINRRRLRGEKRTMTLEDVEESPTFESSTTTASRYTKDGVYEMWTRLNIIDSS